MTYWVKKLLVSKVLVLIEHILYDKCVHTVLCLEFTQLQDDLFYTYNVHTREQFSILYEPYFWE